MKYDDIEIGTRYRCRNGTTGVATEKDKKKDRGPGLGGLGRRVAPSVFLAGDHLISKGVWVNVQQVLEPQADYEARVEAGRARRERRANPQRNELTAMSLIALHEVAPALASVGITEYQVASDGTVLGIDGVKLANLLLALGANDDAALKVIEDAGWQVKPYHNGIKELPGAWTLLDPEGSPRFVGEFGSITHSKSEAIREGVRRIEMDS